MHNPLGSLARELFGGAPERRLALLSALWPRVVGPEVARRSKVIDLQGEQLRVRLPQGPWRRTIVPMRGEILLRLRSAAGSLAPRRLYFIEGEVEDDLAPFQPAPAIAEPLPLPQAVEEASHLIDDPESRERFRATAARYIERFRRASPPSGPS